MVFSNDSSLCSSLHKKGGNFLLNLSVRKGYCGCRNGRNDRILGSVIPNAKKKAKKGDYSRKKSRWKRFFLEEDGNWLGFREEDLEDDEGNDSNEGDGVSDEARFEGWRKRADAIIELREAQEGVRNEEKRYWEDWLVHDEGDGEMKRKWGDDDNVGELKEEDVESNPNDLLSE